MFELIAVLSYVILLALLQIGGVALGAKAYRDWRIMQRDQTNSTAHGWPYGEYESPFPWHHRK